MANFNVAVQFAANVGNAASSMGGLRQSITALNSGVELAQKAFAMATQVIDATVGPTVALATQQRDLARVTGMTAEEAGVMIQATDDMGISYGSLQSAAEKLNKEGLSLNAENLRDLRAEYQLITDPVERAEFATDKFGKAAGPEMQKALDLSNSEFESFIASAEDSALVLSGEAVDAARKYEIAQDNMADAVESFNVIVGQELMPLLTDVTNFTSTNLVPAITVVTDTFHAYRTSVDQIITIYQVLGDQLLVATGQMTAGEAATRAGALAHEDAALSAEQLAQAVIDQQDPLDETNRLLNDNATAVDDAKTASINYASSTRDATQALADMQAKQAGWASSTGQDVINALDQAGVEGREYEAALLAVDQTLGTSFAADAEKKQKLDDLAKAYADGLIGLDDFKSGLRALTEDDMPKNKLAFDEARNSATTFFDNLEMIPREVRVNVHTDFTSSGAPPPGASGGFGGGGQGGQGSGFAGGGIAPGPESGHWELLHGPEAVVPLPDGRSIPVEMRGQAPINIAIDARGALDPRAVEDAGYRGAKRALREAGVSANIRIRTGG